jgi:Tn3 transposase DDE domain-containing protein
MNSPGSSQRSCCHTSGTRLKFRNKPTASACLGTVFRWVAPPRVIASFPRMTTSLLMARDGRTGLASQPQPNFWRETSSPVFTPKSGSAPQTVCRACSYTVGVAHSGAALNLTPEAEFRELGRVVRTIFSLRYLSDAELRRTIQAATNKSESSLSRPCPSFSYCLRCVLANNQPFSS